MNHLLSALSYLEPQKEFIVLCCILFSLLSLLVVVIRAYISFKVKQEHCDGRFNVQDTKIQTIAETSERAESKADEAITAVREIKPKVEQNTL